MMSARAVHEWIMFGIDVFQASSGTNEAFCLEVTDTKYAVMMEEHTTKPFETYCM